MQLLETSETRFSVTGFSVEVLKAKGGECQHNTGFSDTGSSETGFSDTGFSETGFSEAGFSETGF